MKSSAIILALCSVAVLLFTGCASSSANIVFDDNTKRAPLSENDKLSIAFATDIPVIPENATSIATVRTDPEAQCSGEAAMNFLTSKARQLGANLLYVKKVEIRYIAYTIGFVTTTKRCQVLYADFLDMKREGN